MGVDALPTKWANSVLPIARVSFRNWSDVPIFCPSLRPGRGLFRWDKTYVSVFRGPAASSPYRRDMKAAVSHALTASLRISSKPARIFFVERKFREAPFGTPSFVPQLPPNCP